MRSATTARGRRTGNARCRRRPDGCSRRWPDPPGGRRLPRAAGRADRGRFLRASRRPVRPPEWLRRHEEQRDSPRRAAARPRRRARHRRAVGTPKWMTLSIMVPVALPILPARRLVTALRTPRETAPARAPRLRTQSACSSASSAGQPQASPIVASLNCRSASSRASNGATKAARRPSAAPSPSSGQASPDGRMNLRDARLVMPRERSGDRQQHVDARADSSVGGDTGEAARVERAHQPLTRLDGRRPETDACAPRRRGRLVERRSEAGRRRPPLNPACSSSSRVGVQSTCVTYTSSAPARAASPTTPRGRPRRRA